MLTLSLILIGVGFVGWWATGIDDTLMLAGVLRFARGSARAPLLFGHVLGVLLVLTLGSAAALGLIQLEQGIVNRQFLGLPVQNFAGLLPIAVGVLALREALTQDKDAERKRANQDNDDLENLDKSSKSQESDTPERRKRGRIIWSFVGLSFYLTSSVDDLALHIGVLAGVIRQSSGWSTVLLFAAFWLGTLIGELTSLVVAHWLSVNFKARRGLEISAALAVIAVGGAVLLLGR